MARTRPTGKNGTMPPIATIHFWNRFIISQKDVGRAYSNQVVEPFQGSYQDGT